MRRPFRKAIESAGYAVLAGSLFALGVNFLISVYAAKEASLIVGDSAGVGESYPAETDVAFDATVLIDSVLTIVQSYYVDSARVSNQSMFIETLKNLGLHPQVRLETLANRNYILNANGKALRIEMQNELTYHQLLQLLVKVSGFLSEHINSTNSKNVDESWAQRGEVLVTNALLQSLDAHTSLLSTSSYNELKQGTEGAFGGLGIVVGVRNDVLTVLKPLPRSPALHAGLRKYDRIIAIDNFNTYGFALDQLVEHMRGAPGTTVNLGVLREGEPFPKNYALKREMITVDSVTSEPVKDGTNEYLWVRIESFSSHTAEELAAAIMNYRKAKGHRLDGLILDLRSNPGGLLDQAIEVSNLFIDNGVIVSTKGRRNEVESTHSGIKFKDFPVAVLINEDSASASEIVAGALQDHQRAVVIGQPSFGKGSVQTIFELPGQQALKLTIARYYTPLGKSIQNVGIQPDIWLHPLVQRENNKNLLGMFRYRGERFLKNRLEAKLTEQPLSAKDLVQPFKGYYVQKKDPDDFDELDLQQPEMKIAKTLLREVHKIYPNGLNRANARSGHWLAIAGPKIKQHVEEYNKIAKDWLVQKHQIAWDEQVSAFDDKDVKLLLPAKASSLSVVQGEELTVPWRIINSSTRDLNRVSVFATPLGNNVESVEMLVGSISAGSQKSGVIKIKTSRNTDQLHAILRVGVAVDAQPTSLATELLEVELIKKDPARFDVFAQLDHEKGGSIQGTLEANEVATLRVHIKNESTFPLTHVKASVSNLAGLQLKVPQMPPIELGTLKSNESKSIDVPVAGAGKIYSNNMVVGVFVQSEQAEDAVRQSLFISSKANTQAKDIYKAVGH